MEKQLLLPRKCKLIGGLLLPIAILNLVASEFWNFRLPVLSKEIFEHTGSGTTDIVYYDYTQQAAWIFVLVSLVMIAFSKQKIEDEYVQSVRLRSLLVSVYMYAAVLLVVILFMFNSAFLFYGYLFLLVLPLLMFIVTFNYRIYIQSRLSTPETK